MRIIVSILFIFLFTVKSSGQCNVGDVLSPITVDSVTVDAAGNVTICWQASPDPDIAWYYIFHVNPLTGANDIIDSVAAPGPVCFTIPAANNNSTSTPEEYAIGVRDLCDNEMLTVLDYHNTIYLENTVNICSATILLNWNAYDDFSSGLNVLYNVYVSENAGPYTFAGSTSSTNFSYIGVNQGSVYSYYVMAIENGGVGPFSSSSNVINVNTNFFLQAPNFLYLYTASVIDSLQIDVQFYVDTAADIKNYTIQRASSPSGPFSTISTISASKGMNPMVSYSDYDVESNHNSYVYRVNSINLCGDLKLTSNNGKSILLEVTSDKVNPINTLTFSAYEDWQGGVLSYEVYRAVGGVWESAPITSLPSFIGTITYTDNVTDILYGDGEFCYKVIATESPIAHVANLPAATSTSNEACVEHDPIFYVPNAFAPISDHNPIFKPVLSYADPLSYSLTIFDRWGKKIFETSDINEGWNGLVNNTGVMCPVGAYVYSIQFESALEEIFQKRGTITLIR
jgi:gliding motility-associated-like protein